MRRPLLPLGYQSTTRQAISLSVKVHVLYVYGEKIVRRLRRSLLWVIWDCTGVVRRPGKYVKKEWSFFGTSSITGMPLLSHYLEESSCWKHPLSSQTGTRWLFNKFNLDKDMMSSVSSVRKSRFYTGWAGPKDFRTLIQPGISSGCRAGDLSLGISSHPKKQPLAQMV